MRGRSLRLVLGIVGVAFVLVAVAVGVAIWWGGRPRATSAPLASVRPPAGAVPAAPAVPRPPAKLPGTAEPEASGEPEEDPLARLEASEGRDDTPWAAVDLEAVRATMPKNLYWAMSAPTKDPDLIRWREEERARWNVEYGKVLSNTATKEEVDAYYAHRQRLSTDYIEFAGYLLTGYSNKLAKQDLALLKLAIELHHARLEEIPRQLAEAHQRREAHEVARRAWLEEQKAFQTPLAVP
jgi:hypothetical protein